MLKDITKYPQILRRSLEHPWISLNIKDIVKYLSVPSHINDTASIEWVHNIQYIQWPVSLTLHVDLTRDTFEYTLWPVSFSFEDMFEKGHNRSPPSYIRGVHSSLLDGHTPQTFKTYLINGWPLSISNRISKEYTPWPLAWSFSIHIEIYTCIYAYHMCIYVFECTQ